MRKIKRFALFLALTIVAFGCRKGDDDPWLSLRSRNHRIIGKWTMTRYFYYDGSKSGVNNSGDPITYYIELRKDGNWYSYDEKWQKNRLEGQWAWADESDLVEKKEVVILGYQDFVLLQPIFHILEKLRYKEVRSRFQFDGNPKRYFIYEWSRKD